MLADTIRYRAFVHAVVYSPGCLMPRPQATLLYNSLAERVFPGLGFRYTPQERAKGGASFKIEMVEEKQGEQNLVVLDVPDMAGARSLRVLIQQTWPESSYVASQRADAVYALVREALGEREAQLAETRVRAQVATGRVDAFELMASSLSEEMRSRLPNLGNVQHLGLSYVCEPVFPVTDPLGGAKRTVNVEPLREEKGWLYLEVMSQWGLRAFQPPEDGSGAPNVIPGPLEIETCAPSRYIEETMSYITGSVCPFLEAAT